MGARPDRSVRAIRRGDRRIEQHPGIVLSTRAAELLPEESQCGRSDEGNAGQVGEPARADRIGVAHASIDAIPL